MLCIVGMYGSVNEEMFKECCYFEARAHLGM
jgi:hypothetical protein